MSLASDIERIENILIDVYGLFHAQHDLLTKMSSKLSKTQQTVNKLELKLAELKAKVGSDNGS